MATTTQTRTSATAPSSRPCPNYADALASPPCPNCGWEPGLVPVALTQTPDGSVTTFAAEKRHRFMLAFGVLCCLTGMMILIAGFHSGGGGIAAGIIFGPLLFAAGVMTLKNTRGGKAWWGLSAREKGLAIPGLIVGGLVGVCIIPALLIGIAIMKASADAWR